MAIAFVQSASATAFGGVALSKAYNSNNTAGNLLVLALANDSTTIVSVVDTKLNTWVQAKSIVQASTARNEVWYAENCGAGANTVTIAYGADIAYGDIKIHEYSGAATSSALDAAATVSQNQVNPGTGANAVSSGTATPSVNGCLIFGTTTPYSGSTTTNPGTGFTQRENPFTDTPSEDQVQTTAASIAATFTNVSDATSDFLSIMAVFKPASGGTTLAPTVGSEIYSGNSPALTKILNPADGIEVYTGNIPSLTKQLGPTGGSQVYSGANVFLTQQLGPTEGSQVYSGGSPDINFQFLPTAGSIVYAGEIPSLASSVLLLPADGLISFTGMVPDILFQLGISEGEITFTGQTPSISISGGTSLHFTRRRGRIYYS